MATPYEMEQRIRRLEQLVEGLYRQLEFAPPPEEPDRFGQVRELVGRGKLIPAIKMYRELTGVGLKEAKKAVEAMAGR